MSATGLASTRQGAAFFVNIDTLAAGDIQDSTGATATVNFGAAITSFTVGKMVVRDLGKTVRVPAQGTGNNTSQRILRKVQRVDSGADTTASWPVTNGFVGFNEGVGGAADSGSGALPSGFQTFYIELNGVTGGATAGQVKWARLAF